MLELSLSPLPLFKIFLPPVHIKANAHFLLHWLWTYTTTVVRR